MNNGRVIGWLDRTFYENIVGGWDDEFFRKEILKSMNCDSVVLDVGAGAGIVKLMNFRGIARKVCGIDLDSRVLDNEMLDEAKIADGGAIPYPDDYFDIVFSDNVVEHLKNPIAVFGEIHRVLKPGGRFLFKTPNRNHYMPMIAIITPLRFHKFYNKLRGRNYSDTFPTEYRCNTRRSISDTANALGFRVECIKFLESRPEYLRLSSVTYVIGLIYERFVNRFKLLEGFRIVICCTLSKKGRIQQR